MKGTNTDMPFVLDASIAACWVFDDEDHPVAAAALERIRHDEAVAPSLWWFEVRNTLIVGERRGRLTEADTTAFLRELSRFGVALDRAPQEMAILTLARQHRLTVYDASYLELAQREALPLATLDAALRKAAAALDIELTDAGA
jgi:predicted nucleic acid-binding protein